MAAGVWWARSHVGPPTDRRVQVRGYADDRHSDGAIVDVDPRAPMLSERGGPLATGEASEDRRNVRSIQVTVGHAPPGLWFLFLPETAADPPAVNLVAFDGHGQAPGTVFDSAAFGPLPVRSSDQVGAVRWWPSTGQVHQIYVQPTRRRQGIGTVLLFAAGTYRVLMGWPPVWASGQRTDLGEAVANNGLEAMRHRAKPRTHRLPPMTPADKAVGVPRPQLLPDTPPRTNRQDHRPGR